MRSPSDRNAVERLLSLDDPADAIASYYALHHDADKVDLILDPPQAQQPRGYVSLARTGIDLFRPLATMRLPEGNDPGGLDLNRSVRLLERALPGGLPVIITGPDRYAPLIRSQFSLQREESLVLFVLDRGRFEPIVNVLVAKSSAYNGLPRFVIRQERSGADGEILASAGLNWQSPQYAELYVHTKFPYRRRGLGRSVVAAAAQYILESGRIPLYVVAAQNQASRQLAESVGFVDLGLRRFLAEGSRMQ